MIEMLSPEELRALYEILPELPVHEQLEIAAMLEELEKRQAVQRARDSLIEFCRYMMPEYKVGHHHKELAAILEDMAYGRKKRAIVNIAPRFGKLIADETPVMTPTGWTTHGDLQPGDYVFHPSGYPVKVVAVSDKGPADIKMTFGTGQSKESIYCHENHEWMMYQMSGKTWKVRETKEFLGEKALKYLKPGKRKGLQRAGYQLPNVEPLVMCEKHLPMHPYAFGVWLGDGTTGKPCITHHVDDTAHLQKIQNMGYKVSAVFNQVSENTKTTSFGGPRPGVASQFRKDLEATGAFKNKHIPEVYKLGSIEQRLELLAGLVDADGYCDPNGRVFIGTVCPTLADDIADVVNSFGWRPYRVTVPPTTSSSGIVGRRDTLYVGFNPTLPLPVAIERKQNTRFGVRRKVGLWGVERDPAGKVGKCIQVDSPDGLYLVGKTLIPTHNSQITSIFFPAWFIGHFPEKKIMMVSHTAELAVDFGRKVRNVVSSEKYAEVFSGVSLSKDSKSAGRWSTNKDGEFYACGVGGALAGRGADLLVIDDPHNEQEVLNGNYEVFDRAYDWYAYGARTRLMPGGAVAVVMTRWAKNDLAGKLIDDMAKNPGTDQWNVVEFPALLERKDAKPDAEGKDRWKSLWPEQWPTEELLTTKASMPAFQWSAQYLQNPTSAESAIIKREWWKKWTRLEPPKCEYVIMALDAAAEKNNRADFTSITTWGVFMHRDLELGVTRPAIILLNSIKRRIEFPELKRLAKQEYVSWEPDWFVVEKKSSGTPLYQELRRIGVPVQEYTPHRGSGDKFARLNSVADLFAAGLVWYPEGHRWAEEVVDEVCGFPAMPNDDIVDTTVMALMRFRQGGFVRLDTDSWEDDDDFEPVRAAYY